MHERSDRDDHLIIHWNNIEPGAEDQFEKLSPWNEQIFTKFDFESIMLYGPTTFSKDYRSRTMTAKNPRVRHIDVHNKSGLSADDIFSVNKLYKCTK